MKTAVIIPVGHMGSRNSVHERAESIQFAWDNLYSKMPVHVVYVAQDCPWLRSMAMKSRPHSVVETSHSQFCKGWLYNVGVKLVADYDIVILAESDMYALRPYLPKVGPWMAENGLKWCFAWSRLYYSNREEKRRLLSGKDISMWSKNRWVEPTVGYSEGGFVAFKRDFFLRIGGCDERFRGLGGPDNELAIRARHASGTYRAFPQRVIHLWHPKVRARGTPSRERNKKILKATRKNPGETIGYLRSQNAGSRKPYE